MYQEYGYDEYVGEGPMVGDGFRMQACIMCGVRPAMYREDYCPICIDVYNESEGDIYDEVNQDVV